MVEPVWKDQAPHVITGAACVCIRGGEREQAIPRCYPKACILSFKYLSFKEGLELPRLSGIELISP